jgi:4-hydroxybenzoate polyprenyltransferase
MKPAPYLNFIAISSLESYDTSAGIMRPNAMRFLAKLRLTLEMIKFEHSVFALPFALTGALLAVRGVDLQPGDIGAKIGWIVVAMVGARSAAMAFNRIADAAIDARNPRTRMRAIPAGLLSRSFTWAFVAAASALLVFAAARLNPLCLKLSPVALAVVFSYSYTKRFTALSHLVLGFALGIAPAAAWIAVRGRLDPPVLLLTAAVMLWTAGFDIIYSCQDYDFDRAEGLYSLPARLGIGPALWVARSLHLLMVALLAWLAALLELGALSLAGIVLVAALLLYEHSLVKPGDLSRVNAAFFTVNGVVSVLFFVFWAADVLYAAGH